MSRRRLVSGSLIATALAATMWVGTYWTAQAMQAGLVQRAHDTLESRQLSATVLVSGRDAYVWAETPTARADAMAALRTIPGIRVVLVGEGAPPAPQPLLPSTGATPRSTARTTSTSMRTGDASPTATLPSTAKTVTSTAVTVAPVATAGPASTATTAAVTIPAWPAVPFDGDSATVSKAGGAQLVQIAQFMVAHPTVSVVLTGYTDASGTAAGRQALGGARAASAQAVLVGEGVDPARITVASGGGTNPVASNSTSQGRALNRRVTVTMTQES